jgi:hypothetical protein
MLTQLRGLVRSIISGITFEDAMLQEKSLLPPAVSAKTKVQVTVKKRGSSGSSSSSANSVAGMVDSHPSSYSAFPAPIIQSDAMSNVLPAFDIHGPDMEPFFNLENDSVIVARAVSTRNVAFQEHQYPLPPSTYQPQPFFYQQSYYPPFKKSRPNPTTVPSSRVPNPIAERHAK